MDEPNGTEENTTQDKGQASTGETGTPKGTPTHTQAQVDEILQKDRMIRGRDDKALKAREDAVAIRETEADRIQKERDAEDLKAAEGNPEALNTVQTKQALKARESALAKSEAEHRAEIESARETRREVDIWQIASKYGVDADTLKALNLDKEKTEDVAKAMSGGQIVTSKDGKSVKIPDSGRTIGGESWKDLSPDEKIRKALNK